MGIPKKSISKKPNDKYFIKEHHLKLFYDFIGELDKIPDSNSKLQYLRTNLYRVENITPFKVISKYFIDRIVYEDAPEIKILPLSTEEDINKKTYFKLNLPQIDLVLTKGLSIKRLRQEIEDWIYSTKGIVQRFLCDYANGTNIYKIPKNDLKSIIDNKRIKLDKCKIHDLQVLSEEYIGYNQEYLKLNKYIPKDWIENNPDKCKTLPTPRLVEFFRKLYWRKYFKQRNVRAVTKYKHYIDNNVEAIFRFRFPAICFNKEEDKFPLLYFIKRNDLIRTNINGYLGQYMKFLLGSYKSIAFVGYYLKDEFRVMICTISDNIVRNVIEEKTAKYSHSPITLMSDFETIKKKATIKCSTYGVTPKFRIARKIGTPLMSLHHLLNHIILNKFKNKDNLVIMLINGLIVSPKVKVIPAVLLEYNSRTMRCTLQTLNEERDTFKIHINKVSYDRRHLVPFVGKKVWILDFDIGGKFVLVELLKGFTWETEVYDKKSPNRLSYW